MSWGFFLEVVNFSPKFLGLSVGILRNFWDCFLIIRAEFQDCFRTVWTEFLGLFSNSPK